MIKNINRLLPLLLVAAMVTIYGCKKETPLTVSPPHSHIALADNSPKTFFVFQNAPGDTYKVPVGITNPTNRNVTVNLTYSSTTAVAGTHYTAPASITIPAGKVADTALIKGIFANIPTGVAHRVVVKVSGGDLPVLGGRDSLVVILRRYCPVDMNSFAGNYTQTREFPIGSNTPSWGPYTSSINMITPLTATTASARLNNVWDYGFPVNVIFDWTDPANFKVTMNPAIQPTGLTAGGVPVMITAAGGGQSTFSSCEGTVNMFFRIYAGATDYDNFRMEFKR